VDATLAAILSKLFETTAALNTAQQKIAELEARAENAATPDVDKPSLPFTG
jgi:hypothetical protein